MKLPRLKEVREGRGWSQKKLAEESGVSRDSISNYETGHREAWPATAKKLSDALGVEIADLREPMRELATAGKAEAPRGAGQVSSGALDEWLEEHGAKRALMSDEQILDNLERLASGPNREAIPNRFEQEGRETIREEAQILEDLWHERYRGGALIPKTNEPLNPEEDRVRQVLKRSQARTREYRRLSRKIRFSYLRYLTTLDRFGEALFLEGRVDDFVMVASRPQIAEARRAALRQLRDQAFENERGA